MDFALQQGMSLLLPPLASWANLGEFGRIFLLHGAEDIDPIEHDIDVQFVNPMRFGRFHIGSS